MWSACTYRIIWHVRVSIWSSDKLENGVREKLGQWEISRTRNFEILGFHILDFSQSPVLDYVKSSLQLKKKIIIMAKSVHNGEVWSNDVIKNRALFAIVQL